MNKNKNLHRAQKQKNNEFYTRLQDVEKEIYHYRPHFKDKVVYCNCDDPTESKFFHYFSYNFHTLGLKKLIASCYKNTIPWERSSNGSDDACYIIYEGHKKPDGTIPLREDMDIKYFKGDGDFRSQESIELLKQSDIVVTNPPFSLFKEFISQMMEYNKKFLVVGPMNSIAYKEISELFKNNKIWLGFSRVAQFYTPENTIKSANAIWFTNLENRRRNEKIYLYERFDPELYLKYDNYNAINVDKVKEIPKDYYGYMGVPITFMERYNPKQFKILGLVSSMDRTDFVNSLRIHNTNRNEGLINNKKKYMRLIIQRVEQPEGLDPEYPVFPNPNANTNSNNSDSEILSN